MALAALVLAALPGRALAASTGPAALRAQLSAAMAQAGPFTGAYVYDISAQRLLFNERGDVARPPASMEKLYTSITALARLGPFARLDTRVLGVGSMDASGVWHGDLYLRGGGDPTFGTAAVADLAQQLTDAGITHVTGRIVGDETLFDSARGGPSTGYAPDPELAGMLSALAFDRGQTGSERGPHAPAAYAALALLHALRAVGVTVNRGVGTAATPAGATQLAEVQSPQLSALLDLMLPPSDNFFAEMLLKDLGADFGGAGGTTAGAAVVRRTIALFGIHAHVVDGSGLSHADRTSPHQIVTLLDDLYGQPLGTVLRGALAVAGRSGTLAHRMRGTAAAGRCQAKTGTLNGVSNLAGWCNASGGHTIAFALEMDGIDATTAHVLQDNMTITIARYDDGTQPLQPPAPPVVLTPPGGGPAGTTGPTGATGSSGSSGSTNLTGGRAYP
jgi:serine-type D-Ala-D-Ala carboxypeptidase/endopeptidase (penicillin-binding protein 4)